MWKSKSSIVAAAVLLAGSIAFAQSSKFNVGRPPTDDEIRALGIVVAPDGTGLPDPERPRPVDKCSRRAVQNAMGRKAREAMAPRSSADKARLPHRGRGKPWAAIGRTRRLSGITSIERCRSTGPAR